jgi:DnaJ family protein C protein 19
MSSGLILGGLALAAIGFGGRMLSRTMPKAAQSLEETLKTLPMSQSSWANSKYYKGGFEAKMSKREAALILGVSPNAQVQSEPGGSFLMNFCAYIKVGAYG